MTLLITDPLFLEHETGRHVEVPGRLRTITGRLLKTGLVEQCRHDSYIPLTPEAVAQVHDRAVIERARLTCETGGGLLDADTVVCSRSYEVALAAAGACVSAVDAVLKGQAKNALALVRPPGHHATPTKSMGFCLFNNIALAAHQARTAHGLSRILIVDWDVHHGNGTQDIFWDDSEVFFLSIHRYGHGFYPGTGAADETGTGPGLSRTVNVPVRHGVTRREYHGLVRRAVEHAADHFKPELILVSAGFDAHVLDPIGSLGLETEDFAEMTRLVLDVARAHCQGRLMSCLEGGYHWQALAESVQAHLEELLGAKG